MDTKQWQSKLQEYEKLKEEIDNFKKDPYLEKISKDASELHVWLYDNCPHENTELVNSPFSAEKIRCDYCGKYIDE